MNLHPLTQSLLSELIGTNSKIKCSAVVSRDGWTYAYSERHALDENTVCAFSSAIFTVCKQSIAKLAGGGVKQITLEGEDGNILITLLSNDMFLTTVTEVDADIKTIVPHISSRLEEHTSELQ